MSNTDDLLARVLDAVRQAFLDEQLPTHPEIPDQVKVDRVWAGEDEDDKGERQSRAAGWRDYPSPVGTASIQSGLTHPIAVMNLWQPIETAPKDGTALILVDWRQVCLISGCPLMGSGYWHDGLQEWTGAGGSADVCSPTHWTPLRRLGWNSRFQPGNRETPDTGAAYPGEKRQPRTLEKVLRHKLWPMSTRKQKERA